MNRPFLNEQEQLRNQKLNSIRTLGIDPYPSKAFAPTLSLSDLLQKVQMQKEEIASLGKLKLVGRIMQRRVMGAASFVTIQEGGASLQLYITRDFLSPGEDKHYYNTFFKKLLDIGDIIGVEGDLFFTKTEALSLKVEQLTLLSKALSPLPSVKEREERGKRVRYNSFTDSEQCYRQRYLDLLLNPITRKRFQQRAQLLQVIRNFFNKSGYLEVETPILQPLYGGASARPFVTHHNTLDMPLYLRISNELYLKRLIVGGYEGVYEFAKDFRNEGMSRFHNPEFSMVELYVAYQDYHWMMDYTEKLFVAIAKALHNTTTISYQGNKINFGQKWKRYTLYEAIAHFTGEQVVDMQENELRKLAKDYHIQATATMGRAKLLDEIFSKKCEPHLMQPTFITDYPVEMSPLAKQQSMNPSLVERFEVICNGKEICNAFSELNDPLEQRKRFEAQQLLAKQGDKEAMQLDEDYIKALSYGMPPTAGLGIGIDRLVMLMTDAPSIQDVILFPQMRLK